MVDMHGEYREMLNELCKTEAVCGTCAEKKCLVGFSKYINYATIDMKPPHLKGASAELPKYDMRGGYDEDQVLKILATTLVNCRSCKDNHTDDCCLAVIRDCMEMIEFGENISYKGEPLSYIVDATVLNETKGNALAELYNEMKAILE